MNRPAAETSVKRLLAMVPWIAAQPGGVPLGDVCDRFGVKPEQLRKDLTLLSFVGPTPRTPDTLIDVSLDDDWVFIRPQWFDRPLRLTPMQALLLVASGEAVSDLPGSDPDGPLGRGLRKLADALKVRPGTDVDVELGQSDGAVVATIAEGVDRGQQVWIRYHGLDADTPTERVIEPWAVGTQSGAWATVAWCSLREDRRWFRLDRVVEARLLETPAEVPRQTADTAWSPPEEFPLVTLRVGPTKVWAVERWPTDAVRHLDDGSVEVDVRVGGPGWLERVLMQLGDEVQVVADPGGVAPDRRELAGRILRRYRG